MIGFQVITVCFATIAFVQAFPGNLKDYKAETYKETQENAMSHNSEQKINKLLIMRKDPPKKLLTTIDFVNQSKEKNMKAQPGQDKEKYIFSPNILLIDNKFKINETENKKESNIFQDFKELVDAQEINSTNIQNEKDNSLNQVLKHEEWLLIPKKLSSITNQPRYIYDIIPISPFPEEAPVTKDITTQKEENVEDSKPTFMERTYQSPEVEGPMLYPQSTYLREFDLPFFD